MGSAFRVSIETLSASPLRTFLSTLGIVIGVASLVAVLSLGEGMEQFIRSEIGSGTDVQLLSITPRTSRGVDGTPIPLADTVQFAAADVGSLQALLGASSAVGLTANGAALVPANLQRHSTQRVVRVLGISAGLFGILHLSVVSGRALAEADTGAAVVLISRKAARDLSPPGRSPIGPGDSITMGGARFVVLGVLGGDHTDETATAVLPVAAGQKAVASVGRPWLPSMIIRAPTLEAVSATRAGAARWLTTRFGRDWKERVTLGNNSAAVSYVQRGMLLFKLFMAAITGISLLVGGIGIMNVLLAAIAERTREIGVRRAVGAARGHILAQFLAEAVTISALGSAVGIVLGLVIAFSVTAVLRARTQARVYAGVSLTTLGIAVVATVVVGLTFGLYPALRASRLSPVDAMRND